jgi:hypothetical protein
MLAIKSVILRSVKTLWNSYREVVKMTYGA